MKTSLIKTILSIVFVYCFFNEVFAQSDKGYLGLSAGLSNPTGNFGSNDINNNNAGFATTGFQVNADGNFLIGKYVGFSTMLSWGRNSMDLKPFVSDLLKVVPNATIMPSADKWKLFGFMAGLYLVFPIKENLNIESRIAAGGLATTLPAYDFEILNQGKLLKITRESNNNTSLAYNYSLGMRYHLEKVSFTFMINYLYANTEFKDVFAFYFVNGTYHNGYVGNFKQEVSTLNFTVGIGLSLGNLYH